MCTRYLRKSQPQTMPSLLSKCLEYIINNLDLYSNELCYLPIHIKNRILKTLTSRVTTFKNVKQNFRMLIHSEIHQIDFRFIAVDDELLNIISCCHNLRTITLSGSHENCNLTENGLIEVMSNFKLLHTFDAPNCSAITDNVVKVIVNTCTKLTGLDVSSCRNITDVGLIEISRLTNLQALSVSRTQITNDGIIEFLNGGNTHRLKELRIAECSQVTHDSINLICKKCPGLEVLIFYNCEQINDQETVNVASENLKKLKQLSWTVFW